MSPQLPLSLDSSIVSCLLRPGRNPQVVRRYESSVEEGTRFILCPLVYYEVRRGLLKLAADGRLGMRICLSRSMPFAAKLHSSLTTKRTSLAWVCPS
jgi:hypothetical protein